MRISRRRRLSASRKGGSKEAMQNLDPHFLFGMRTLSIREKVPDEVACLREVYGNVFWLVTVFAPRSVREPRLKGAGVKEAELSNLIATDEYEGISGGSGQNVRETSELGDFFIRNDKDTQDALALTVRRYLEILFNVKFIRH